MVVGPNIDTYIMPILSKERILLPTNLLGRDGAELADTSHTLVYSNSDISDSWGFYIPTSRACNSII
jgi:hypothetical protein